MSSSNRKTLSDKEDLSGAETKPSSPKTRTNITNIKEEEEEEEAMNKPPAPLEGPAKVDDVDSFSKRDSMNMWFGNGSRSLKRKREVGEERVEKVPGFEHLNSFSKRVWRRRWLRNGLGITEREVEVDRGIEEEKDPSLGALALLGKALNGPGRCDVRNGRGCTVWK